MSIISIIPARGGSKGIPLKNLKILNGKPLLDYSVSASLNSKLINKTIVSTDNQQILLRAEKLGANVVKRPKKLSTDSASIESTILHCLSYLKNNDNYVPDTIVLLQNTSPLRTVKHIDDAIKLFLENRYDSLLSGYHSHHFFWKYKNRQVIPINYNPRNRPNRQQFNNQFIENGAIYITKYETFKKSKCRVSGKIGLYEMSAELSVDIDTRDDFEKATQIMKRQRRRFRRHSHVCR